MLNKENLIIWIEELVLREKKEKLAEEAITLYCNQIRTLETHTEALNLMQGLTLDKIEQI